MPGPVLPGAAGDKQVLPNWSCTRNQAEFCFSRKCSHWHGSGWSSLTLRRRCQGLREACFQAVSLIAQGSPLQSWPHFLHDSKSNSDMAVPTLVKLELFLGRSQTVLWGSGVSHYRDGWVGGWVPTKPFACRLEMGAQIQCSALFWGALLQFWLLKAHQSSVFPMKCFQLWARFSRKCKSNQLEPQLPSSKSYGIGTEDLGNVSDLSSFLYAAKLLFYS